MPAIAHPVALLEAYGSPLTQPWQRPLAFAPLRPHRAGTGGALPVAAYALVDAAAKDAA